MQLHSPTSTPASVTAPVPSTLDVGSRVDYQLRQRPSAEVTARGAVAADHDDTLVPAALAEIEAQRSQVELLLEAGVLGSCLSD